MTVKRLAQVITIGAGLFYLFVTLTMFVAPYWFYENVGHFPPFNRHYMGDTASFLLPLAIGLLVAARDPLRYRLVIGIGALASVIHTFNHAHDAVFEHVTNGYWLLDFTPLVLLAVALVLAYYQPVIAGQRLRGVGRYGFGKDL